MQNTSLQGLAANLLICSFSYLYFLILERYSYKTMWLLFSIKNWRIIIIYIKIQKILQDKNIFDKKRAEESKKDKMVSTNFYEDRKIVFISDNTKYVSLSVTNSWANSMLSLFRNVWVTSWYCVVCIGKIYVAWQWIFFA